MPAGGVVCGYGRSLYPVSMYKLYSLVYSPVISDGCKRTISQMLVKSPADRITLDGLKCHSWVTLQGVEPMPDTSQNCPNGLIEVDDEDIKNSIRSIPKLETLVRHMRFFIS